MANDNADKIKAFQKDLKALLKKHNASIGFGCSDCSDLHGVYDEKIIADIDNGDSFTLADGMWLSPSDIED